MVGKNNLPIATFIDYGSKNGYGINEPQGVKISVFPGTVLYYSPNKTKLLAIDLSNITFEDDNNMPEMDELLQSTKYDVLKTTCIGALPNFKDGSGDNLWAYAIYILECILGRNPVTDYGDALEDVAKCIHQKDFYGDFKKSKIYLDHYETYLSSLYKFLKFSIQVISNFFTFSIKRTKF